jgi:predicted HicB family RNase H-like nuclease
MQLDSNTAAWDYSPAMVERTKGGKQPESRQVVTSLRIDGDIHERAKILAVRQKTSLQAIVNEALAEYLKKKERDT